MGKTGKKGSLERYHLSARQVPSFACQVGLATVRFADTVKLLELVVGL